MAARRQRGYTLIEVLVAFAVLAIALTVLLSTLSNAGRQVRWSDDAGRAAIHARSVLDATFTGKLLANGGSTGELEGGRYRWTLQIDDYQDPDPGRMAMPAPPPNAPRLVRVALEMRWGDDPREKLHVDTLRLLQPTPEQVIGL